jgi:hypothetical protein
MGDFRIVIDAVGGHGQDREKGNGEVVNFTFDGNTTPEALAQWFIDELKKNSCTVDSAKVIHWPLDNYGGPEKNGRTKEIVDDLITGVRTGSFKE